DVRAECARAANADHLETGTRVEIMIRPDDITFVPDDAGSGLIVSRHFRGSETVYCIHLPSGHRVHSSQPSSSAVPTGIRVRATASLLHVVAFTSGPSETA